MTSHRLVARGVAVLAGVSMLLAGMPTDAAAQGNVVKVINDQQGSKIQVDGEDFMVLGMNWGYVPIGENYAYDFWGQSDDFIEEVLASEMTLLQAMGCNAIRQYVGIPAKWITYIYENYGIYTVLNHAVARWGATIDGVWVPNTDYSNPRLREIVKGEVAALVDEYKDVPGLLMWLLGNENNYGLTWSSFEIEALPKGEQQTARARYLYSLYGELIQLIKSKDMDHPVSIANGDLQYIDLMVEECQGLDIFGTNVYRGISVGAMYQDVWDKMGIPLLFTEFGADAFNAKELREDQAMQCKYLVGQWQEIYEQSYGKGRVGNSVGGLTFQWSDGWWKFKQEENLDVQDINASWPNGGYTEDFVEGENNMNEEWWGICAKGFPNSRGLQKLYPRSAYYALQKAYELDPYGPGVTRERIKEHFGRISLSETELQARGNSAALAVDGLRARVKGIRMEFETISTGGERISTPEDTMPQDAYPRFQGFDRLESYYLDLEATPSPRVRANLQLNILGNVPTNPINEIFYENAGRTQTLTFGNEEDTIEGLERVRVHRASVEWDDKYFRLNGFYREGHLHWGYEGDFFGFYRDAYYGPNLETYNGKAPNGFEVEFKKHLSGLKVAYGPELWWGANPAILAKYQRTTGKYAWTMIYHEDIDEQGSVNSTFAVPVQPLRRGALNVETTFGPIGIEAGGIWSGQNKVEDQFQVVEENPDGTYEVLRDEVKHEDTFGGKVKLTWGRGPLNWYGQAAHYGIVADGGPEERDNFTGWAFKDTGSGNQRHVLTGFTYQIGDFQFGPNFLYQKPIAGPVPGDVQSPGRPRNIFDDPFAVRGNRETTGGEIVIVYDPTPATWFWQWDNDRRENAKFAASVAFQYRDLPTTMDAAIGVLGDGVSTFAFPGGTPARELWEVNSRIVSALSPTDRIIINAMVGTAEPNGADPRLIERGSVNATVLTGPWEIHAGLHIDDFGPFDYHRDFNLTFPIQTSADIGYTLGIPRLFDDPQTKIGVRGIWRTLDQFSPRYCPGTIQGPGGTILCDPLAPGDDGQEWEIRTYLHISM